jgi:tRNA pseudouridine38-40 synthase
MLRNLMLTLAYDGADFHGWQHQPQLRTVQGTLETALRRVLRHQVRVIGCSRTDAGVHAAAYVANLYSTSPTECRSIFRGVGSRLPKDMTLLRVEDVPLTFHATSSALSKLYRYRIHNTPMRPCEQLNQRFVYHFWHPLDPDRMRRAADAWIGTHDFSSFASAGNERESNIRTVLAIHLYRHDLEIRMDIEGEGFLYKQVRNMMGTLIEIGRGHWEVDRAAEILAARRRSAAGPTAAARGLSLQWVRYDLTSLPEPSAELLERARTAAHPAGAQRANVERRSASTAPAPPDAGIEEPPA